MPPMIAYSTTPARPNSAKPTLDGTKITTLVVAALDVVVVVVVVVMNVATGRGVGDGTTSLLTRLNVSAPASLTPKKLGRIVKPPLSALRD